MLFMQCKMEVLRTLRNRYYIFWSLLMPILFYYIFTKVVNTGVPDPVAWQKHYLMSMTIFSVMGSSIMTLGIKLVQERTQGWSTFIRITPLPSSFYLISKMVAQTIVHALSIVVIFIAGVVINQVSLKPIEWIGSGLWILVGSVPFLGLGLLVGLMKRVETASGVSNILYMAMAVTGGIWTPMELMSKTMQAIGKALPAYNFGNGAWEIVQGNTPELINIGILAGYSVLFVVLSVYIRRRQEAV